MNVHVDALWEAVNVKLVRLWGHGRGRCEDVCRRCSVSHCMPGWNSGNVNVHVDALWKVASMNAGS